VNSTTNDIAKQLVTEISTQVNTYSLQTNVSRCYTNNVRLDELQTLHIFVIPRGRKTEIYSRGELEKTHSLEIGFQKHISNDAEADTLSAVVESIQDWILGHNATITNSIGTATFVVTCLSADSILADNSIFSKEHFNDDNVFTAVLVCEFNQVGQTAIIDPAAVYVGGDNFPNNNFEATTGSPLTHHNLYGLDTFVLSWVQSVENVFDGWALFESETESYWQSSTPNILYGTYEPIGTATGTATIEAAHQEQA
jgi:hypothetical protein